MMEEEQGVKGRLPDGAGLLPTVEPVSVSPADAAAIPDAWATIQNAIHSDPEYAWAWHCNLAVPIMDAAGLRHEPGNVAAAYLMATLWGYDITRHPRYQYGKSDAQIVHEGWMALDRDSDGNPKGGDSEAAPSRSDDSAAIAQTPDLSTPSDNGEGE
jgi:hypothetical protein